MAWGAGNDLKGLGVCRKGKKPGGCTGRGRLFKDTCHAVCKSMIFRQMLRGRTGGEGTKMVLKIIEKIYES